MQLKRAVGSIDLVALGIGGTVGTGIFVIIGDSGPAINLSFVLAGVTGLFSAFSYAELAAAVPVSGIAYTGPGLERDDPPAGQPPDTAGDRGRQPAGSARLRWRARHGGRDGNRGRPGERRG